MAEKSIYQDITKRTGGDIYVGVVGPVRTGKSTFIHKFLDLVVLPNIEDDYDRQRTLDTVPQSATGKTVMTTEPKCIPDDSVRVSLPDKTSFQVKLIDCVGYMVDGALGGEEDGESRMVTTPWSEEPMPFPAAAEIGTRKVISEHSTIGMLVTTDGSITDLPREAYVEAEERVARELLQLGKPFAIVLNSKNPESPEAQELAAALEEKYGVPVALVNCLMLNAEDIREILALVLGQFPVRMLKFRMPEWTAILPEEHPIRRELIERVKTFSASVSKLGDIEPLCRDNDEVVSVSIDAGEGVGEFSLPLADGVYYDTLSEMTGEEIQSEKDLFECLSELTRVKKEYDKVAKALSDVNEHGYGIVMPRPDELEFEEPKLIKQSGGWGVKMSAKADSIHMIRAGIKTELSPVVGTQEQSEEVIRYLMQEFEEDPKRVWESNMFGKSLYDLMNDGLYAKLSHMPNESREKLGQTLERIINEGAGGLIWTILLRNQSA